MDQFFHMCFSSQDITRNVVYCEVMGVARDVIE